MNKKAQMMFVKLLTLCSMGFLSACTLAIGTYAWFSANGVANGEGMGVFTKGIEIIDEVIFHPYYNVDNPVDGEYTFDINGTDNYDFGLYSLTEGHKQSLVEVKLKEEMSIELVGHTNAIFYLGDGAKDSNGHLIHGLQLENNSLTSIVEFYTFASGDVTSNDTYLTITKSTSKSKRKSFVNSTYTDLISDSELIIDRQENISSFFIMIDYDSLSISTIYAANLGNPIFESTTIFNFSVDFSFDVSLA